VGPVRTAVEELSDFRRTPRFIVDPPIHAVLDGEQVEIYNIGESGIQIETSRKLQRNTYCELRFSLPISPRVIRLEVRVAWVRQARKGEATKAWPYRCGLRVEHLSAFTVEALAQLLRARLVRPDRDSLERKRLMMLQRAQQGQSAEAPVAEVIPPPMSLDDCITRVQGARAILRGNPELAVAELKAGRAAWRDGDASFDVIALWNHLGRVIDPSIISVVLDLYPPA
jgi:hypothetical protein